MKTISIIGAGGWGTALAITLAEKFERLHLWVFEPELCAAVLATRVNDPYLPGCLIPANVRPTPDLEAAVESAGIILTAVPSQHLRGVCDRLAPFLQPRQLLVSATKGLESHTHLRMSEVIEQVVAARFKPRLVVLSGPTFAKEVARGSPTAVVAASRDADLAEEIQHRFSTSRFRVYSNTDVVGVELCGSVKNVIAIAAGVCEGLGLGSNTIAAVITRGLSELSRLASAYGARRETTSGLAGLGDLVLTCTGASSRNHWAGVELGRGRTLSEIMDSTRMAIEGVHTTEAALELARKKSVEMPITEQMFEILHRNRPPREAVRELMERSLKSE